jgi:hypothetical protein
MADDAVMRLSILLAGLFVAYANPWTMRETVHPEPSWYPPETRLDVKRIPSEVARGYDVLLVVCFVDNNVEHGPLTKWDGKSGRIEALGFADHGVLNGPSMNWYPNRQLQESFTFVKGQREGPLTIWHANGAISDRAFLHNGEPDGLWERYDDTGHLSSVTRYSSGRIIRD